MRPYTVKKTEDGKWAVLHMDSERPICTCDLEWDARYICQAMNRTFPCGNPGA